MDYDEFRDVMCHWNCDNCKHCNPKADLDGVVSTCKRLDHKRYSFAKAPFASYDCGQRNGFVCGDFEPVEWQKWLAEHWDSKFLNEHRNRIRDDATVSICIDHDWDVKYQVLAKDFFDGTFINEDGSLKWVRKGYYKRSKTSPIGYVYVYEYTDGTREYGANKPLRKG